MGPQPVERIQHRRGIAGEDGMSLIEMMVAILILGVILSSFAGSLISFSKMSLVNERRVQATAFLTRLHEDLQSIPWDQAAIYDDMTGDLAVLGADLTVDPPTLDGDPVVLLEAPDATGCPDDEPDCTRSLLVPEASGEVELDGRRYEFVQVVSWDTTAPVPGTVKRFTTLVRWVVGETEYEQRFESTRAITAAEAEGEEPPEIRRLFVSPSTVTLDDEGRNIQPIDIDVEFDHGMTSARVEYQVLTADGSGTEVRTVDLAPLDFVDSRPVSFTTTILAASDLFPLGSQQFRIVGVDGVDTIVGTRSVDFVDGSGGGPQPPPAVGEVIVSSLTQKVGAKNEDDGRLCAPLTVTARVDGLVGGLNPGTVTLYYLDDTSTGVAMTSVGTITGDGDEFTRVFDGLGSPWRPTKNSTIADRFRIIARNPDGGTSSITYSDEVTFSTNANEKC